MHSKDWRCCARVAPARSPCRPPLLCCIIVAFALAGTPKKSSVLTTKVLSQADVEKVFGAAITGLQVSTFSRPRSFQKQYKTGSFPARVSRATVVYSSNTQTCKVKAAVTTSGDGSDDSDDYCGMRWF